MLTKDRDRIYVNEHIKQFPLYVSDYVNYCRSQDRSEGTLRGYLIDYEYFFQWLIESGNSNAKSIHEVTLNELNQLRVKQIAEGFINFTSKGTYNPQSKSHGTKLSTVNRKISSVSSLFNYLANIAEDDSTLEPYLTRNVMARIQQKPDKDNIVEKAKRIRNSILIGDREIEEYRAFIADGYKGGNLSTITYKRYLQNRERDLAINSLILSTGLRIQEVETLSIDDVSLLEKTVKAIRKGNKERILNFSEIAKRDLEDYLEIRLARYNVPADEKALFVVKQQTTVGKRFTKRSMQLMIEKYGQAFGKIDFNAHALRHTFATRFHQKNNDLVKLKDAMDHESLQTTIIYTHVLNDDLKNAIEHADSYEDTPPLD